MLYRGTIEFDPPMRATRSDYGSGVWRDPEHVRELKRAWRAQSRAPSRVYQKIHGRIPPRQAAWKAIKSFRGVSPWKTSAPRWRRSNKRNELNNE
jgi:hypothetical protein